MQSALISHTVSFRSAAIRFMCAGAGVVSATMSATNQFHFTHWQGIIPDYPVHSWLFTHPTEKLFIIVAVNGIKILHVADTVVHASARLVRPWIVRSEHWKRPKATGTWYMHHPFAHPTIERASHMRLNWLKLFYFIRICDSVSRTIQSYSIYSYLILHVVGERIADNDWPWLIAGWKDWSNVSINWGNKIYNNFVYCVQSSVRTFRSISPTIASPFDKRSQLPFRTVVPRAFFVSDFACCWWPQIVYEFIAFACIDVWRISFASSSSS